MSVIHSENFDGVTAPAFPASWVSGGLTTSSTLGGSLTPISSPNVVFFNSLGAGQLNAYWNTLDGNGGDVVVSAYFSCPAAPNRRTAFAVQGRMTVAGSTYYEAIFDSTQPTASGGFFVQRWNAGTPTVIGTPVVIMPAQGIWYRIILGCIGPLISATLIRTDTGEYLNPSGSWQSGQVEAVSVTDPSPLSGQGYGGLGLASGRVDAYADSWSIETGAPVVTPPPLPPTTVPFILGLPPRVMAPPPVPPPTAPPGVPRPIVAPAPPASLARRGSGLVTPIVPPPPAARPSTTPSLPRSISGRAAIPPTPAPLPPPSVPQMLSPTLRGTPRPPRAGSQLALAAIPTQPVKSGTFGLGGICGCCDEHPCTCHTTICVQGCGGAKVPGATVVIRQSGDIVASCTTDNRTGCCGVCLPGGAGDYEVSVTAPGYEDYDATRTLACDGSITVTMTPVGTTPPCYLFVVTGCCGIAVHGATIDIDGDTYETDGTGSFTWCAPGPGTYPYTVSGCHFDDTIGEITVESCSSQGNILLINLQPASGYICGFNGPYPTGTTLDMTDSVFGAGTLIYDAPSDSYLGSISGCTYPATSYCPAGTFTVTYSLTRIPGGCGPAFLRGAYSLAYCNTCPPGFLGAGFVGALVPSDDPGAPFGTTGPCAGCGSSPCIGCPWRNAATPPGGTCSEIQHCTWTNTVQPLVCPMDYTFSNSVSTYGPEFCTEVAISPSFACSCLPWWIQDTTPTVTITEP